LVERGDVFRSDGVWDRRAVDEIEVPETIRSVVGQRLGRLGEPTRAVLAEASVLGQTFAFEDLVAVSERSERDVEDALDEASGVGLIRDIGRNVYGFDHALTQQSVYAELSSRRKRRLHLAAGEALEHLPERRRAGRVAEIAWHFVESDDPARAITYAMQAGEQAEAVFAHHEGERQYRVAVELARDQGDGAIEAAALEKLGKSLEVQSLPDGALEALDEATRIYHTAGDLMGEARASVGVSSALMHLGNPDAAIARLQGILASFEGKAPSPVLAQVCLQLAAILYGSGRFDESLALTARAREVARTIGDAASVASAENYRGDVLMQLGKFEDARRVFEAVIPDAEASGDLGILAHSVNDLAVTYIYTGHLTEGVKDARRTIELQQRRDSPSMVAFAHVVLGMALFYAGQWDEARRALEEAARLIEHLPPSWHAPFVLGYLGMLDTVEGRREDAMRHLKEAIAVGAESRVVLPFAHQWLAEWEILDGRPAEARTRLEPFAGDQSMWTMMMLPTLGWAQVEEGDLAAADALVTRLVTDTSVQMPLMVAEALRVQGMVRHRQGRNAEAEGVFDEAIALARWIAYRHAEARALLERGRLRAASRNPEGAREDVTAACAIFQQLGARSHHEQAEHVLAQIG
jgi:tetratricopeptide (TPR) repeat protein